MTGRDALRDSGTASRSVVQVIVERFDVTLLECILDRGFERRVERRVEVDINALVEQSFAVQPVVVSGRGR